MKRIAISLLLIISIGTSCATAGDKKTVDGLPLRDAKDVKTSVVVELYENQQLPIGTGFSVFVRGWVPNDQIDLRAIGPKEEKVNIMLPGKKLPIDSDGEVQFSVTYDHDGFYPGQWLLVIEGASGMHGHYFNVPAPKTR